ncbi:DUF7556 family protein [Natrononativus amylolyticus]|uniref:DUF7556 family protein n=1 Tax=Natrononativus amylolyticus TaxID=2963434 RepID=UPI0020CCB529|nr:hypothetical protein [Natrononativus amylolyticus]
MVSRPHDSRGTVVSSIDSDGHSEAYIIADIAADDAWLSMHADDAPTLSAWC